MSGDIMTPRGPRYGSTKSQRKSLPDPTPRPWCIMDGRLYGAQDDDNRHSPIAESIIKRVAHDDPRRLQWFADLAHIVEAVNSFEALTAERDALKAENAKLRQATDELLEVIRPFAVRGMHTSPVQHVTLGSCQRARAAYDRRLRSDFLVLPVTP